MVKNYNPFVHFAVTPNFVDGHWLEWRLDPAFNDPPPHHFTVEISQTQDFSELSHDLDAGDNWYYLDRTGDKLSLSENRWYRIRLETDRQGYVSPARDFGGDPGNRRKQEIAAEINRKELLRAKKYTGSKFWLFRRKYYGRVDDFSVDPVSGAVVGDSNDFGVGYEQGYYKPLMVYISREEHSDSLARNSNGFGMDESSSRRFRTAGIPLMVPYDILANDEGRYNIRNVRKLCAPGSDIPIVQNIQAEQLSPSDPTQGLVVPATF